MFQKVKTSDCSGRHCNTCIGLCVQYQFRFLKLFVFIRNERDIFVNCINLLWFIFL